MTGWLFLLLMSLVTRLRRDGIMLWWLLLVLWAAVGASCPPHCQCDDHLLEVTCLNASLEIVPMTLHPAIQKLRLQHNSFKEVGSASFQFHPELTWVNLADNGLVHVQDKTFEFQRRLVILELDHNLLQRINNLTFYGLESLRFLNLSHNVVSEMPDQLFIHLPQLSSLDLTGNRISGLRASQFARLNHLNHLLLSGNLLTTIPPKFLEFPSLPSLVRLDLSFNQIAEFFTFGLGNLEWLDVSDNPVAVGTNLSFVSFENAEPVVWAKLKYLGMSGLGLSQVPVSLWPSLPGLEQLSLNSNNLTSLRGEIFRGLARLIRLDVLDNRLLRSVDTDVFRFTPSLVSINISQNPMLDEFRLSTALADLHSLRHVVLVGNRMARLSGADGGLLSLAKVDHLSLDSNPWSCECDIKPIQDLLVARRSVFAKTFKSGGHKPGDNNSAASGGSDQSATEVPRCADGIAIPDLDLVGCSGSGWSSLLGNSRSRVTVVLAGFGLVFLVGLACVAYQCRSRIRSAIKGARSSWGRDSDAGDPVGFKQPGYGGLDCQKSFITYDEYFISLARHQAEQNRHIPVTEL